MRVVRHGVVDSTNERALASVADGSARHGDVHVAEGQSAGRGRRGHAWASARGEGLYLSLVLLPEHAPRPTALTMAAGLALLETVHALGAHSARLKWPNDVLAGETSAAKLAGILVEARGHDPARPHAVVGIGLNVGQAQFPAELEAARAVTSLLRLGLEVTLEQALAALLERLGPRMRSACTHPAEIAREYGTALGLLGREVRVQLVGGEIRGRLAALSLEGVELERLSLEGLAPERLALHEFALEPRARERSRHLLEHVQGLEPL